MNTINILEPFMTIKTDKTRVDDIIIEMIQPKLTEIERKFSEGKGLTQDDINTLLLKSQYNHINHLDDKLNEVTADVASLKLNFDLLKSDLYNEFKLLKADFNVLEQKVEKTIEKALNKNMVILVAVLGLFLTISKVIDKYL